MERKTNAVILAAGLSSRLAPLSYERPKGLLKVRGEILIERQIRQLHEAGINEIYVVTGYKAEMFQYLEASFDVRLIYNPDYAVRNNNASIKVAKNVISNTYICSVDDYYTVNPFTDDPQCACYAAVYSAGRTKEWCMKIDSSGYIRSVTIGGCDSWYMMGYSYWDEKFSENFLRILDEEYSMDKTRDKLWESIFVDHLAELHMKIKRYPEGMINEFDTLQELSLFDPFYKYYL